MLLAESGGFVRKRHIPFTSPKRATGARHALDRTVAIKILPSTLSFVLYPLGARLRMTYRR